MKQITTDAQLKALQFVDLRLWSQVIDEVQTTRDLMTLHMEIAVTRQNLIAVALISKDHRTLMENFLVPSKEGLEEAKKWVKERWETNKDIPVYI